MEHNHTNDVWQEKVHEVYNNPDYVVAPRGMEVKEVLNGSYAVQMPAYLDFEERDINTQFMFAEAAWIVGGSNKLSDITPYMKSYEKYSDDGIFMRGAYGPKVVDQLGYVCDSIINDEDTRQAVMTIWRERPGQSKDIPCTVAMQFLLRENELNMVTTMRSQDIVLGFTYDVFTFSMVAAAVQRILHERGREVTLGTLFVNAGSLHLYESHYEKAQQYIETEKRDPRIKQMIDWVLAHSNTYDELVNALQYAANQEKKYQNDLSEKTKK